MNTRYKLFVVTLALISATPTTLAVAPSSSYVQVQDTETTETTETTDTTGTDTTDGAAEQAGEAVDDAAAATGEAVDDAATAADPNGDGVVDSNNDGVADTRQFPWGLLGLLGLAGLMGRKAAPRTEVRLGGPTDGPRKS